MSRNMAPFLHPKESLRKEVPSGCIADSKHSDSVCLVMSAGEPPVYLLYQRERARWATSSGTLPEATSKGPLILFSSFLRVSFVIAQKCRFQSSREDVKGALHWARSIWYVYVGRANRSWIYNFAKCNYFFFFFNRVAYPRLDYTI